MNFKNISAWSIRNPTPALVLFAMLTFVGIFSFSQMQINNSPDIDFPVVIVTVSQPGAAPSELEKQVTLKIESAVRNLSGIDEINSTVSDGQSTTVVKLAIGTPIDRAVEDVRSAVQQVRSDLPEGILEPQIERVDTSSDDLASYAAVADDMTLEQLSWYVDNTVAQDLLSIPNLAHVTRNGGVTREIRVILDPHALQAQGLTAGAVNAQLRQVNLDAAGGRAEIAGSEQSVRVIGNARTAYDLSRTQISAGGGRTVKLTDIAQVQDLYGEPRSSAALDGHQVLSFDFQRAKGGSDVAVYHAAVARLAALEKRNPKVHFKLIANYVKYTEAQYASSIESMIEGAVLAVIVVFVFLRDWRSTVIAALAIPLSAIPTFWIMDLLGFTLNSITLLALSLVAGVLVDDAIVEIENIVRHMRMGKSAYQASIDAADEIGLAVVATTMAIVAVFLPVGLMPGISGQFFKNFGLTVVAAVLMSLAVARLITPMVAAHFLRTDGHREIGERRVMRTYMAVLHWTLLHRWAAVVASLAALVLTGVVAAHLPSTFQPDQDQDTATVSVEMAPGTTLAQTQIQVDQVAALLRRQGDVATTYQRTFVGTGQVTAIFKPRKTQTSSQFERGLAARLAQIGDARVSFVSDNGGGSGGRDLSVTLTGDDPKVLTQTAQVLVGQMSHLATITAPRIAGALQRPEILVQPRVALAASMGVTTAALSNAVRIATLGEIDQNSAKFSLSDRQIPIRVAFAEPARRDIATIKNLPVEAASGGSVPLGLVAEINFGAGPTKIDRVAQKRQITVGADRAPGVVSGTAMQSIKALPIMRHLPVGVAEFARGQERFEAELQHNFLFALLFGVLLLFAVLVLLYRRVIAPLVNIVSIALAPLGGLLALFVTGNPISLPVFIGILMLLGIVAKNSILLIDFALEEIDRGVDPFVAIVDAGHKRAQPIVMTTVAMVAGMVPTALSLGGDGAWRAPLGITVIGGLALSTVLTLVIVPSIFSLAIGFERWMGAGMMRRLLPDRPGDDGRLTGMPALEALPCAIR